MQALVDSLKLDVAAGQVRGGRQPLKIVRVKRVALIGAEQRVVGVTPRPPSVALTAVLKKVHCNHVEPKELPGPCSEFGTTPMSPSVGHCPP